MCIRDRSKTQPNITSGVLANADTVFILKTDETTYKTCTGIANVPGYTKSGNKAALKAYAVVKDDYAKIVYIDVTSASSSSTGADELIYLFDTTKDDTQYDAENEVTVDAVSYTHLDVYKRQLVS